MSGYVDPSSIVPLFAESNGATIQQGRLTAWDSSTRANTVVVQSQNRVNLPVLQSAEATLSAPCTVLLLPFGRSYIIVGRIRVP